MNQFQFVTRLAAMGHLQPHHVKAAIWLQSLPPSSHAWREIEAGWAIVLRNVRNGFKVDMRKFVMGPIVSGGTFDLDDNHLGLFREALNVAFRVMNITFARAA